MRSKLLSAVKAVQGAATDLRGLVLVLAMGFLFFSGTGSWIKKADEGILNLEAGLVKAPAAGNRTAVISQTADAVRPSTSLMGKTGC